MGVGRLVSQDHAEPAAMRGIDDVPPLATFRTTRRDITLVYFDGTEVTFPLDDPIPEGFKINPDEILAFAEEYWPYLQRCFRMGSKEIGAPVRKFSLVLDHGD